MSRKGFTVSRHSDQRGSVALVVILGLLLVAVVFGGYQLVGVTADYLAEKVPDQLEVDLFSHLATKKTGWTTEPQTSEQRRAAKIFTRLAQVKTLRKLDYKLFFSPDKAANAFAMPGGTIAVTAGLLSAVKGDTGLAMVLAHEFGHQQHRHSLRMLGRSLIFGSVLLMVAGDAGFLTGAALDLAQKSHSRSQELEADTYGLKMVFSVYGTTSGALEFFQNLAKEQQANASSPLLAMLSTHPYTPERIERLKALEQRLQRSKRSKLR